MKPNPYFEKDWYNFDEDEIFGKVFR